MLEKKTKGRKAARGSTPPADQADLSKSQIEALRTIRDERFDELQRKEGRQFSKADITTLIERVKGEQKT